MQKRNNLIILVVVIVVVAAAAFLGYMLIVPTSGTPASDEAAASSTVVAFGEQLQKVSLLAPDASSTIASTYAQYVVPSLLVQWEADPQSAPGRITSSPWPDHIQIDSVTAQGSGYIVDGEIVWVSSTGPSAQTTPIVAQLVNQDGTWQIAAFQEQQSAS